MRKNKKFDEFYPTYSGRESRGFWRVIRGMKSEEAYSLGVVLQNVEEHVLRVLNNLQKKSNG